MATLSVCMIVKNEEHNIERCLSSIKNADEIIIVDTGSTDKTVELCSKYTDKMYYREWDNDFSAARNFSFSFATSDYILWLDADEEVVDIDKLYSVLDIQNIKAYFVDLHIEGNHFECIPQLRVVPNIKVDIWWENKIHEQLANTIGKYNIPYCYTDCVINHFGYTENKIKTSLKRNLEILREQIELEPDIVSHRTMLVRTLYDLGEIDNAKKEAQYVIDNTDNITIKNYFESMLHLLDVKAEIYSYNNTLLSIIIRNTKPEYRDICIKSIQDNTALSFEICENYNYASGNICIYISSDVIVTPHWDFGIIDAFNISPNIGAVNVLRNKGKHIVNTKEEITYELADVYSKMVRSTNKDVCYIVDDVDLDLIAFKKDFVDNTLYGILDINEIQKIDKKVVASDVFVYQF